MLTYLFKNGCSQHVTDAPTSQGSDTIDLDCAGNNLIDVLHLRVEI